EPDSTEAESVAVAASEPVETAHASAIPELERVETITPPPAEEIPVSEFASSSNAAAAASSEPASSPQSSSVWQPAPRREAADAPAWEPPRASEPAAASVWQTPAPPPVRDTPLSPGWSGAQKREDAAPVVPLSRNPIRPDVPPPLAEQALSNLDQLLRLAAARGASMLYLSSASRPSVRIDGEIYTLDGAPVLGPNDVESLLLTLMPERNAEALRTGVTSEWICDLPDVGRVRCLSFRDHRGPGGVFRMMPVRAITAEQLGLTREIQSLMVEPEGLVLVAGPRASGKRTLMSAFVDLINRTRRDHVISIETEINVVHERNGSFISQREVRGGAEEMYAAARGALREDPDVLVLEEVRTAALMNVALEAAASGQLVIAGFPAHDATGAVDRIIDLYPSEYRRQVQLSLAQNLRGVISQVLLRKRGGGRVAAREVLLNTPAVAGVLAEGRTSQLPLAIEGGRKAGMMPLNDALVGYVQTGAVDVQEAYRRSANRAGFIQLLKRQGVDTSAVERFA
ncbi:MAG TPA: ATPase, T2SS/T4P/T4SS family, partial [Vicinamibacterales bacterium]|nr:ATPase, T2SS/T4P/T4SS family [Vicinamibacterales bacterium]